MAIPTRYNGENIDSSWFNDIKNEIATFTPSSTNTLTNKTIDADNNTIVDLTVTNLKTGVLDTDLTTTSASHDTIPSALAVKDYLNNRLAGAYNLTNNTAAATTNTYQTLSGWSADNNAETTASFNTTSGVYTNSTGRTIKLYTIISLALTSNQATIADGNFTCKFVRSGSDVSNLNISFVPTNYLAGAQIMNPYSYSTIVSLTNGQTLEFQFRDTFTTNKWRLTLGATRIQFFVIN